MSFRRAHADSRQGPRISILSTAVALACISLGNAVFAQNLAPVTVQSDWLGPPTEESVKTYTGARTVLEKEDLEERGALNLEDALRRVPGVQVLDETGTGILPNIGVRGLNPLRSERLQILVDGYPIAIGPYTNVGLSLFPVTLPSLEAVDLVRGGAAVHYGPNNVGGVLNLVTKPIPAKTSQTFRERLQISEETGNMLTDTYYRIGGFVREDIGLQFQANIVDGKGQRDRSDTEVRNFIVDGEYYLNPNNDFKAQLQYYEVKAELPGALSPAAYEQNPNQSQRPFDAYDADMWRATFTWNHSFNEDTKLTWRNFAHQADRTFFFSDPMDPALPVTSVSESPRIFSVHGTEPRITRKIGNHTIIAGARFVEEDVRFDVTRTTLATGAVNPLRRWDFSTTAMAYYLSDSIALMENRLTVTPGIRYEDVETNYRDLNTGAQFQNNPDEWLPGLTVGYQATKDVYVFANAQRSLVPVQTAQVTRGGDVGNETAENYEIGSRWQINPQANIAATLFRVDYKDQIVFDSGAFRNLGETRQEGVELEGRWNLDSQTELGMSYTYLDTEQLSGADRGKKLRNAPTHHIGVDAVHKFGKWTANANALYVSESFSDSANTQVETANGSAGELPAYTLVNMRVGRDFPIGQGKNMNLGFGINNLFDEQYFFRGVDVSTIGRVPAPGRMLLVEMQVDF
ncbi:TonB-dependent receptor family protein [Limnobacter sp. P1]|jgi:Fe(3+) dicitrate transport protein|uniref:TonB-dependent receptor family protein n=1 Tax=Limnobacter olei TaxID=3031298 RepID=UPI0023B14B8A|nr:TonB-dependent receptor [Limnobacter sp. P1]